MDSQSGSRFPTFADGDVLILLDSEHKYTLHANVLRSCSETFRQLLPEETGAKLTGPAKSKGAHLRWRLDLNRVRHDRREFVARPVDSHGQTHFAFSVGDYLLGSRPDPSIFKNLDNMLRAFYNEPLQIDGACFMSSLNDAWSLATLAEEYGAIKTVSERVDVALLRHGQSLFRAVANNAVAWMDFACLVRSEVIFRSSLIHLVGQWGTLPDERKKEICAMGQEVCERKFKEFQTFKQAIEMRIAGHYPSHMHKAEEENPGRASYANDIYAWVALSLFRHWFSQNVTDGTSFRAADGGFRFYSLVAKGGRAYLDRQQLEAFHVYFPMTHKAKLVLENYLNVLKSEAQQFVAPLMKNNTGFDLDAGESFSYLVSLDVTEKDIPWREQGTNEVPHNGALAPSDG